MIKMKQCKRLIHCQILVGLVILTIAATASQLTAADVYNMRVLVTESTIEWESNTLIGAYTYDPAADTFYVGAFGYRKSLLTITNPGGGGNTSWLSGSYSSNLVSAYPQDLSRFMLASDIPAGVTSIYSSGYYGISGMLLNPAPITVDGISYGVGELAFVSDLARPVVSGGVTHPDWTKKLYRWDLRSVGYSTTDLPDYDTGQDGTGNPNVPPSPFGALGQADWNDILTVCIDAQEIRDETARVTGLTAPEIGSDNFGRQFAWSTDGQYVYCVDTGNETGGIYKAHAGTGDVELIYSEPSPRDLAGNRKSNLLAEPGILHTSVFNYGSATAGDQIIFDGSEENGNFGGINYIVDNGSTVSTPQVILQNTELWDYCEAQLDEEGQGSRVNGIVPDADGNLYFYANKSLHMRDTKGRMISVVNRAQLCEFNYLQGSSRTDGGGMGRMQIHEKDEGTFLTYRSDNSQIASVQLFEPGDLDYDGDLDQADKDFLIAQYRKDCYEEDPTIYGDINEYRDFIRADINGSSYNAGSDQSYLLITDDCVTFKDIEVMSQFVTLGLGDFDWDGDCLDVDDWAIFNTNFDVVREDEGLLGLWSWFDGDVTGDGLVNAEDLAMLNAPPLPGDANRDGVVDKDDAAILAGNWLTATDADWCDGDFNDDGVVNEIDATILAANWQSGSSATASVPEPAAATLLLLAGLFLLALRRRNK